MRSRCGKSPPASIVVGMASAAASETAPRMPVHATMAGKCQCTRGLALADAPRHEPRQVGAREDPQEAYDDDGRADTATA